MLFLFHCVEGLGGCSLPKYVMTFWLGCCAIRTSTPVTVLQYTGRGKIQLHHHALHWHDSVYYVWNLCRLSFSTVSVVVFATFTYWNTTVINCCESCVGNVIWVGLWMIECSILSFVTMKSIVVLLIILLVESEINEIVTRSKKSTRKDWQWNKSGSVVSWWSKRSKVLFGGI